MRTGKDTEPVTSPHVKTRAWGLTVGRSHWPGWAWGLVCGTRSWPSGQPGPKDRWPGRRAYKRWGEGPAQGPSRQGEAP